MIKFALFDGKHVLIPDIKELVKFANGDLGISDGMKTQTIIKQLSQFSSIEDLSVFKKSMGFELINSDESYLKNNKFKIKKSDIILDTSKDLSGLKAFEKSLIQSIFETQKPYTEVFTNTVGALVRIEDIIARVLSLGGHSLKPKYNPKALGYIPEDKNTEIKIALSKLKSLRSYRDEILGLTQSFSIKDNKTSTDKIDDNNNYITYQILSTVYSTGDYDPTVNYTYEYIDIISDDIKEDKLKTSLITIDDDEKEEDKPKVVVFGIFDKNGHPISESKIPKWLINSPKWYDQFDMVSKYKFIWTKKNNFDKKSFASPGKKWAQKLDPNGSPIVIFSDNDDIVYFKNYFNDVAKSIVDNIEGLSTSDKNEIINEINNRIDYKLQISAIAGSGFLPTLQLKGQQSPIQKTPFKPKKIEYKGNRIWIDPEDDYDMKIIKVVPTFNIKYRDKDNNIVEGSLDLSNKKNLKKNQVGVFISKNKRRVIIDISQIKNDQLSISEPYSKEYYGSSTDENKQSIDEILRYATGQSDDAIYYIVEGILESKNDQAFPIIDNGIALQSGASGPRYYKKPRGPIRAIGAFIKLIINIFSKLIPSINKLLILLKSPGKFIVEESILKKMGDNGGRENIKFEMFSKSFMDKFNKLSTMKPENRKKFVEKSQLENYVHVDDLNNYKFILDGSSLVKFLSFTFGISMINLNPKLTFRIDNLNKKMIDDFLSLGIKERENPANSNINQKLDTSTNQIKTSNGDIFTIEEVSIQYSTGDFVQGVNYEYIYITEYIDNLIKEGDLLELSDDPESQNLAISKYELALSSDPNNKVIKDKLDKVKDKVKNSTQPLFSFLLKLVTFPLDIIKSILDYIIKFFKSLSNPFSLPNNIKDFISFKWILDILNPQKILSILGIKFDIGLFNSWTRNLDSYTDDHQFDLDSIMSMPFMPKMFKVNKEQLKELTKSPISLLCSLLCLIENIINSFIDFLWNLMGLEEIIKAPHIKLCKNINNDVSAEDAMSILNGDYVDVLSSDLVGKEVSYDFAYDILLPDGRSVRDLNYEELERWINDNKDFQFEFDY